MKYFLLVFTILIFKKENSLAQLKFGLENTQGITRLSLPNSFVKNSYRNNNYIFIEKLLNNTKTSLKIKFVNSTLSYNSYFNNLESSYKLEDKGFLVGFKQGLNVTKNVDIAAEFDVGLSWFKKGSVINYNSIVSQVNGNPNFLFPFFVSGNYIVLDDYIFSLGLAYDLIIPLSNKKSFTSANTTSVLFGVSFSLPKKRNK